MKIKRLLISLLLPLLLFTVVPQSVFASSQMINLGTFPDGNASYAYGINDRTEVIGGSNNTTGFHAFLWKNGSMTDLGTLGVSIALL